MNIEEIAFKDRKNLVKLNENDLLDIIELLQQDRKQWINQFTQTHNESVKIQEENQELKDNWNKLREWIVYNKHNENTEQHYLVVDYGTLLGKMQELEQGSNEED